MNKSRKSIGSKSGDLRDDFEMIKMRWLTLVENDVYDSSVLS